MRSKVIIINQGLLMLLLLGSINLFAQDFKTDMEKAGRKLNNRRLSTVLSYKLYDAHTAGNLIEQQQVEVKMWDLMVSIKTSQFHTIKNKQQYLHVDFNQKTMLLNKVNNYKEEMNRYQVMLKSLVNMDSLFQKQTTVKLLQSTASQRLYRVTYLNESKYSFTDITINLTDYTLQRVVMYYKETLKELLGKNDRFASNKAPRIEMELSKTTLYKKLNQQDFAINAYVVKKGKTYLPKPNYQQFEFINYLNN